MVDRGFQPEYSIIFKDISSDEDEQGDELAEEMEEVLTRFY